MRRCFKFRRSKAELNYNKRITKFGLIYDSKVIVVETYQLDTDDVPVLCIVFIVSVVHQCVILQHWDPVFIFLHVLTWVTTWSRCYELLDRDGICVEVLQREVAEEWCLTLLVECDIDIVKAGSRGLRGHFIRDGRICLIDCELVLWDAI